MFTHTRRCLPFWILCLLLLSNLVITENSFGHRLRVFAYTQGAEVIVEASFGDKRPIINGGVTVFSLTDNQQVTKGQTDRLGIFRFTKPQLEPNVSLKVVVDAGQGHQAEWILTPEDLGSHVQPAVKATMHPKPLSRDTTGVPTTADDLAILVEQAVAREIAPLKKMMAEQLTRGPSVTEIIGGIGWIVGIAGLLLAFKKNKN